MPNKELQHVWIQVCLSGCPIDKVKVTITREHKQFGRNRKFGCEDCNVLWRGERIHSSNCEGQRDGSRHEGRVVRWRMQAAIAKEVAERAVVKHGIRAPADHCQLNRQAGRRAGRRAGRETRIQQGRQEGNVEFTNKCQGQALTRCSVMLYCTIWAHSMVALKLVESHTAAPCA